MASGCHCPSGLSAQTDRPSCLVSVMAPLSQHAPLDQVWTFLQPLKAVHTAGTQARGFRSGQARETSQPPCSRQNSPEAAGPDAHQSRDTVTRCRCHQHPDAWLSLCPPALPAPSHFTRGLTEAKKALSRITQQDKGSGQEARPPSPSRPRAQWARRQGWLDESPGRTHGLGDSADERSDKHARPPHCPNLPSTASAPADERTGLGGVGEVEVARGLGVSREHHPARPCPGASVHLQFPH